MRSHAVGRKKVDRARRWWLLKGWARIRMKRERVRGAIAGAVVSLAAGKSGRVERKDGKRGREEKREVVWGKMAVVWVMGSSVRSKRKA